MDVFKSPSHRVPNHQNVDIITVGCSSLPRHPILSFGDEHARHRNGIYYYQYPAMADAKAITQPAVPRVVDI
jgi:hypothetical protein